MKKTFLPIFFVLFFVGIISWYEYHLIWWWSSNSFQTQSSKQLWNLSKIVDDSIPEWTNKENGIQWKVQHLSSKWTVMANTGEIVTWEYDSKLVEDGEWKESKVKWYKHVYTFEDLGIIVSIDDPWIDFFYQKTPQPIYKRYNNLVYQVDQPSAYIERFEKKKSELFVDVLKKNHLNSWCYLSLQDISKKNFFSKMLNNWLVYSVEYTPDGYCILDEQYPANTVVAFVLPYNNADHYFKVSFQDWCAPTCGRFTSLEFK